MTPVNRIEPVWEPLEKIEQHLHGELGMFMWMQSADLPGQPRLHYYKHSRSRSYLVLDDNGTAYTDAGQGRLQPVEVDEAVRTALGFCHPDHQDSDAIEPAWWPGYDPQRHLAELRAGLDQMETDRRA